MVFWFTACFLLFDRDTEGRQAGDCSDAADNDGDGLFDCDDEGCFGSPVCEDQLPLPDTGVGGAPPPPTTGTLEIAWRFPEGLGCNQNDIVNIEVDVVGGTTIIEGFPILVPCVDGGSAIFEGLEPDTVGIGLTGLDVNDRAEFSGGQFIEVVANSQVTAEILLEPLNF